MEREQEEEKLEGKKQTAAGRKGRVGALKKGDGKWKRRKPRERGGIRRETRRRNKTEAEREGRW